MPESLDYSEVKFVHVATNLPQTQVELIERLRVVAPATTITADCFDQFVVSYPKATCRVVQSADLVFANLVEYEMIVRMCGAITTPMVVKKGERGADYRFGAESVTVTAPAVQLVDPTGAGDAFAGAYLVHLARGADQASALSCRLPDRRGGGQVVRRRFLAEPATEARSVVSVARDAGFSPRAPFARHLLRFLPMRVINRTAMTLVGAKPYLDWTLQKEAAFHADTLRVVRARTFGSAFLLPEFELEEDVLEWVEDNAGWLFEFQLAAWTEDESAWPVTRDLKTFREWFRVDIHNVVVDVADDEIEGEEL